MKYKITIEFEVETTDYHDTPPTILGVKDLVKAMLDGEVEGPDNDQLTITIS